MPFYLYKADNDNYKCVLVGYYNLDSKESRIFSKEEILKMDVQFYISKLLNFNDEFLYQTDELQDAIDYLSVIANTEKYNM